MTTETTPEKEPYDHEAKHMLMYFENGTSKKALLKQFRSTLKLFWFLLTDPHAKASLKAKNLKIMNIVPGEPRPDAPQSTD